MMSTRRTTHFELLKQVERDAMALHKEVVKALGKDEQPAADEYKWKNFKKADRHLKNLKL